ncbi:hypothetical protein PAPHI01_0232 [Pancytospora philotis]|nr:hypothetical protein PAPHI01_0232 [Pancytospora philotis]
MSHIFCSKPERVCERVARITDAFKMNPKRVLAYLAEQIVDCQACQVAFYGSDVEEELRQQLDEQLCSAVLSPDTPWQVLQHKHNLRVLIERASGTRATFGFKGLFIVMFGSAPPGSVNISLDGETLGKEELGLFLEAARSLAEAPEPRNRGKHLGKIQRCLYAFRIYLEAEHSYVTDEIVSAVSDFHVAVKACGQYEVAPALDAILGAILAVFRSRKVDIRRFYADVRELLASGAYYRLDSAAGCSLLLRELNLQQLCYNSLGPDSKQLLECLLDDFQTLNMAEVIMANPNFGGVVRAVLFAQAADPRLAARATRFIRAVVFTALQWLSHCQSSFIDEICAIPPQTRSDCRYSLLYLSIFGRWRVPVPPEPGPLTAVLIALQSADPASSCTHTAQALEVICADLEELRSLGIDAAKVTSLSQLIDSMRRMPVQSAAVPDYCKALEPVAADINAPVSPLQKVGIVISDATVAPRSSRKMICISLKSRHAREHGVDQQLDVFDSFSDTSIEVFGDESIEETLLPADCSERDRSDEALQSSDAETVSSLHKNKNDNSAANTKLNLSMEGKLSCPEDQAVRRVAPLITIRNPRPKPRKAQAEMVHPQHATRSLHPGNPTATSGVSLRVSSSDEDLAVIEQGAREQPQIVKSAAAPNMLNSFDRIRENVALIMRGSHERESVIIDNQAALKRANALLRSDGAPDKRAAPTTAQKAPVSAKPTDRTQLKESKVEPGNDFFQEFLGLDALLPQGVAKIPTSFANYSEYHSTFNLLRLHEIRSAVVSSLEVGSPHRTCIVTAVEPRIEMDVSGSNVCEYDLIFFTRGSLKADSKAVLNLLRRGELYSGEAGYFIGLVDEVIYGKEAADERSANTGTIARVIIGGQRAALVPGDTYRYRLIESTTTWLREFHALKALQTSPLLQKILNPVWFKPSETVSSTSVSGNANGKRWAVSAPASGLTNLCKEKPGAASSMSDMEKALCPSQRQAVAHCLAANSGLVMIQGPPGTGKTRVTLSVIRALAAAPDRKILVCAPSNTAVDEIVARMAAADAAFPQFVRIGIPTQASLDKHTLDYQIGQGASSGAGGLGKMRARMSCLSRARIVCSTLSSCVATYTNGLNFTHLIVDEACQATELAALIPLKYNLRKIILIGDPKQLPPTVMSKNAALEYSLFERFSSFIQPFFLDTQYRMLEPICAISSRFFYDAKLLTAPSLCGLTPAALTPAPGQEGIRARDGPVPTYRFRSTYFVQISDGFEQIDDNRSCFNAREASAAVAIQKALSRRYRGSLHTVIISPYKAQVSCIRSIPGCACEVSTIDAFQGKEADIVILSTVRRKGLGFVCDFRRINVAITRARMCVFILGDAACLGTNRTWDGIIKSIPKKQQFSSESLGGLKDSI